MKKTMFESLAHKASEVLSREQLKNIIGGFFPEDGGGDDDDGLGPTLCLGDESCPPKMRSCGLCNGHCRIVGYAPIEGHCRWSGCPY